MKKFLITVIGVLILSISGCSSNTANEGQQEQQKQEDEQKNKNQQGNRDEVTEQEITLNLSYGERTGIYTGQVKNGLPDGNGEFTTKNDYGELWTYTGEWKNGHMEGEGRTDWEDGTYEVGTYANDEIENETDYGKPLLDQDGVVIISRGLFHNDYEAYVKLYIENNTEQNIIVQTDNESVNGYMISPMFSCDVGAGKKANHNLTFFNSELEENSIISESIESIELKFKILNENFGNIFTTDNIVVY